jgi:hypothetical protein
MGTVVIVSGFPGEYNKRPFVQALVRRLESAGLRAIAYASQDPVRELRTVVAQYDNVALWATSGNGPTALTALMNDAPVRPRCAVLHYTFTFDAAAAAQQYGFADGCAGKSIDDLRSDIPLFISRAGRDQFAGLNESLDRFVAGAIARNMPVTFVNHPTGPHAFDLSEDDDTASEIIRSSIDFVAFHLNRATGS